MKRICTLFLIVFSLYTYAQDNTRILNNYRSYRERTENRFDWSKSKLFHYLKEYCNHDFTVTNPEMIDFIYSCGLDAEQMAEHRMGKDGFYVAFDRFNKLPDLSEEETNENDGADNMSKLKAFHQIHLGLKNVLHEDDKSEDAEEFAIKVITIEQLYAKILDEINYWPDMSGVSKDDLYTRWRMVLNKKRLEQYEIDKDEVPVKELVQLFTKWKEITSAQLWEKQLICESPEVSKSINELRDVIGSKESIYLSDGVISEKGNIIPYKVIDGLLVVDGLCTLVYKDEQASNATGDFFKKYTTNLKLIVKVEKGKAISQTISGTQEWWDENKAVFNNTKGSPLTKAAAMAKAKPVVVKTHKVTKIEDLGFGAELGIMHRQLHYVLGHVGAEANSLNDIMKAYLLNPSTELLNQLKKPFMPVDVSALSDRQ